MAQKISVTARQELVQAIGERYRAGSREEKFRILDEFVAVTGYHRKHSIRMLNTIALRAVSGRRPRFHAGLDAVREHGVVDELAAIVGVEAASGNGIAVRSRSRASTTSDPSRTASATHSVHPDAMSVRTSVWAWSAIGALRGSLPPKRSRGSTPHRGSS